MAGERRPLYDLSSDNKGPIIIIVSYTLASISILCAIIRFWLAIIRKIPFSLDDSTYLLANVRCHPIWAPCIAFKPTWKLNGLRPS
jgi:hypothetical protein